MNSTPSNPAEKFDTSRASEYARQSRIALAGYDACQDLAAWGQRWRQHGASADEVQAKLGKILQGADPPHSEAAVQK